MIGSNINPRNCDHDLNLIKKGFSVGRDVESMGKDLGPWMGVMSEQKRHMSTHRNHPLQKIFQAGASVEEEALWRNNFHGEEEGRGYA